MYEMDPKKFEQYVNKHYAPKKVVATKAGKQAVQAAKISLEPNPTIIEKMIMVLAERHNQRIGEMFSEDPMRYEEGVEDIVNVEGVKAALREFTSAVKQKNVKPEIVQSAVYLADTISNEFFQLIDEYSDEMDVHTDRNESFDDMIEKYLPAWEALGKKGQMIFTARVLAGTTIKNKKGKFTTRVAKHKLLPVQFLDDYVISVFADARMRAIEKVKKHKGDIKKAFANTYKDKLADIRTKYSKILRGWNFSHIRGLALKNEEIVQKYEDLEDAFPDLNTNAGNSTMDSYIEKASIAVNNMLGEVTDADIKKAKPGERTKLIFAKALNELIYNDLFWVGDQHGWAEDTLTSQIDGWKSMLARFNYGVEITPQSILFGERKALGLLKRVQKITKKREMYWKKFQKTGSDTFHGRAIGRPEVVAFMWDKSGIANRITAKAIKHSDVIFQQFNAIYAPVLKAQKYADKKVLEDIQLGSITIKNSGLEEMKVLGRNSQTYVIDDYKEEDGVPQFHVLRIENAKGESLDIDLWKEANDIGVTKKDYIEGLKSGVNGRIINEIIDGQRRYVVFRSLDYYRKHQKAYFAKALRLSESDAQRHTIKIGDYTYQYVMMKRREARHKGKRHDFDNEYYEAVFVNYRLSTDKKSKPIGLLKNRKHEMDMKKFPKDGWYFSDQAGTFESATGTSYQDYTGFKRIDGVSDDLYGMETTDKDKDPYKIWEIVAEARIALDRAYNVISNKNKDTETKIANYYDRLVEVLGKQGMTEEQIDEYVKDQFLAGGINGKMYLEKDADGKSILRTGNTGFRQVYDNYLPRMYSLKAIYQMLNDNIEKLKVSIADNEAELPGIKEKKDRAKQERLIEDLKQNLENLKTIKYDYNNGNGDINEVNRVILSRQILNAKSRGLWVDPTERRKDMGVISEYLETSLRVAYNNELVASLLQSTTRMNELGVPKPVIDYVANVVKKAVGDPNTRGLFGKDKSIGSYQWVANILNKLPIKHKYDADSAKSFVLTGGGFVAARYLGAEGALQNNTQIFNGYIRYGASVVIEAWKNLHFGDDASKEIWKQRVARTGVENMLSMFELYLLKDDEVLWDSFMTVPGTKIPSHNLINWLRLVKLSRKDFVNLTGKEADKIDEFIAKLQKKKKGAISEDIKYVRGAIYDLLTMDEKDSKDQKLVERRIHDIIGDVADHHFKQMVSWKLSFWVGPGKELFTFTEGEQNMRRVVALAAIMDAVNKGIIARPTKEDGTKMSAQEFIRTDALYSSPEAIEVGRRAVYATMFGMSETHLGEAFSGVFRLFNQFKGYPLQQTQFEYDTVMSFIDSSLDSKDAVMRLGRVIKKMGENIIQGNKDMPYDSHADVDAAVFLRLLCTRFMASFMSAGMRAIPMTTTILREVSPFNFGYSLVRGAESPSLSLLLKTSLWSMLFMMGYTDDDDIFERLQKDTLRGLTMLTMPAILGMLARDVTEAVQWGAEVYDDPTARKIISDNPMLGTR